jgi:restriction system protein
LASPPRHVDFEAMKKRPPSFPLDLGADARPVPEPVWQDFEPPPPGTLGRLFGGDARYARDRAAAERAFAAAAEANKTAEVARQQRVVEARRIHSERQSAANAAAAKQRGDRRVRRGGAKR